MATVIFSILAACLDGSTLSYYQALSLAQLSPTLFSYIIATCCSIPRVLLACTDQSSILTDYVLSGYA